MKNPPLLPPIEHDPTQLALIRVCCRLVELDYRRSPDLYRSYPPLRVLALAEEHRSHTGFPALHGTLIYISKALATGHRLRDIPHHEPAKVWRTISKKRLGLRRS